MDCKNKKSNSAQCNCTYPGCARHGVCCQCLAYHRRSGELPACYFTAAEERTYDRSISFFLRSRAR
jgi:Domain of unknown function (DUF6485)